MIRKSVLDAVGSLIALSILACAPEPREPPEPAGKPYGLKETSLPTARSVGDCDPSPQPDLCTWALSTDAIAWGTIKEVKLVTSPIAGGIRETPVASCEGYVEPALELVIDVSRTLHGTVRGTIVVRIGVSHRQTFSPYPFADETGKLKWSGNGNNDILAVGQELGLPLHWIAEHEVWSLMGETLFGNQVRVPGRLEVKFQNTEGACVGAGPQVPPGITLEGLAATIKACHPSLSSRQRKEKLERTWGMRSGSTTGSVAALCISNG